MNIKESLKKIGELISKKKLCKPVATIGVGELAAGILMMCVFSETAWLVIGWIFAAAGAVTLMAALAAWMLARRSTKGYIFKPKSRKLFAAYEYARRHRLEAKLAAKDKINVVLYCDSGSFWTTFERVYHLMKSDERFNVTILAAPEMLKGKLEHYKACDFLDSKGYEYVKGYDEATGKWFNIKKLEPDYVFYNRHYLIRQPRALSFEKVRKLSKICYIPYATCTARGDLERTVCGFHALQCFDFLFSENESMSRVYEKYKAEYPAAITEIVTSGSMKYDEVRTLVNKSETMESKYVQRILYTPRWMLEEGTCTLLDMYEYFFELVQTHPDVEYIFRPHPLMEQYIDTTWGKDNWDNFIAEFDKYENARIDTEPDYLKTFAESTVMVSDISSMMFEYILTGKPIVHMHRIDTFNDLGNRVARGFYYCTTSAEADKRLAMLRRGEDPLKPLREEILKQEYALADGQVAERVVSTILRDADSLA